MKHQISLLGTIVFMMGVATGCGANDAAFEDEEVREAELAQVDLGLDWRSYTVTYENSLPFGTILVTGSNVSGNFRPNREYWYVNASNLQYLGTEDLNFSYTDGTGTPPSYSGTQEFNLPALATWTAISSDTTSGYRYTSGNLNLRLFTNSSGISQVVWYQTIWPTSTPANVTPSGTFTTNTGAVGTSFSTGITTYKVDQTL
ncbi:hypothetical protein [Polyangium jinanense]|uniref:Uncharacterized protein n=1 Tax=Polyangium jinanense TaxID=2829994 RepID=A0A9X3X1B2_9BACT|nr:hypothetical protein [Polyangium jinanense]MDC3980488.1 hypothetical protein [Polyangium jinanense]